MTNPLSDIIVDLRSPCLLPALFIGAVLCILLVIIEVSFAAMIFSGDLSSTAIRASGLTLFGSFLICLSTVLLTSFKSSISLSQDAPAAVLSTAGVAVVAALGLDVDENTRFMTMAAVMGMSAAVTSVVFLTIGHYKLANLFRFMPYPVVGGFLAGTGWLLLSGSIGVMCNVPLSFATIRQLAQPEIMAHWLPGVLFGVFLFLILQRWSHFLILPGSLLSGIAFFYCGFTAVGMTFEQAAASGFLLTGVPEGGLWPAFHFSDLAVIRWSVVVEQWPTILTAVFVSTIGMLMNISGMELSSGREIDLNREYTALGVGNGLAGLTGCFPGFSALSLSLLGFKAGAYTRLTGMFTTVFLGIVLFWGGTALKFFPKPLLGGLLLLLGLFFIYEWLVESWKKLAIMDYLLVLSIFLTVAFVGFLEGVAFGLCATIVFFVIRFSRVSVIRERFDASSHRSLKQRPIPHQKILEEEGVRIQGVSLSGYIFFGSASLLVEQLKEWLPDDNSEHGYLLLDFSKVTGFDISAVNNFYRLQLILKAGNGSLILTAPPKGLASWLRKHTPAQDSDSLIILPDLDQGLEWCEDALLAEHKARLEHGEEYRHRLFDSSVDDVIDQLARQERFEDLVEALTPWSIERMYQSGEMIISPEQQPEGLHLLVWGNATTQSEQTRLNTLGPGDVIAARAVYELYTPAHLVIADQSVTTALITREAFQRLETENLALALQLHRIIILSC